MPGSAAEVVRRCRSLAAVSEEEGRLTRPFASAAMARANALVGEWMVSAGLDVRVDTAGNLVGRLPARSPAAGTLLLGSHLDTVRDAGAFDGPLGVLSAIACVERLRAEGASLPFAIDVLGFCDEEGLRYGTAYLGSRAVAGTLDAALLGLRDADGVRLSDALHAFGGDPGDVASASRRGERLVGYCEVHIEQGPVLEQRDLPVGVVSAIAGTTRAELAFAGRAGHAGTVPMEARRDAACAAAEWVLFVEAFAKARAGLVATVGRLEARPGAFNVVPGGAVASLDVRHAEDVVRAEAVEAMRRRAVEVGVARGVEVTWRTVLDEGAVALDGGLSGALASAVASAGLPVARLTSGAGHDAVALSALTGCAMLFVRCAGGVSHHPDESVREDDVAVALDVLHRFVVALAARR